MTEGIVPVAGVGAELFERLGDEVSVRDVVVGEVVIRHGRPADGLYRVLSGRLTATVRRGGVDVQLGVLEPGDVAGEISLLAGGVSTATVTASQDTRVAFVPAATARIAVEKQPDAMQRLAAAAAERVDRNAVVMLLADITDTLALDELAAAAAELDLRRLRSGQTLVAEGDEADSAFLVVSGQLAVTVTDVDGAAHEVERLGRGQMVGEAALFDAARRTATVIAARDTVVAELRTEVFHRMLARDPATMARVTRLMVERMARQRQPSRPAVSTLAVVTATPMLSARVVTTQVVEVLETFGPVAHVTAARVNTDLEHAGIADSSHDSPAGRRLVSHLHEVELAHEVTVLEVGTDAGEWSRTALGMADRVLVVVAADPTAAERDAVVETVARAGATTPVNAVVMHAEETNQPRGSAELRIALGVDRLLHARMGRREDLARATRITAGRAVGLTLGGGGARGFAHVGVQQVLRDRGVPIDIVAGSSIGSPIAGGMACGLLPDSFVPVLHRLFDGLLDYTVPVVSLVKGERITRSIEEQFAGWDFEDTWIPFVCVSTNLTRSRTRVHRSGPIAPAVRASVAIPGVLPPVPDGEDLLVDGGVLNNLPVDVLADEGVCGTIIAVDVAPPIGPRARSDFGLSVSGWSALRASVGRGRSGYPGITSVLMRAMLVGSQRHLAAVLEDANVDLLLELNLTGVGLLEFETVDPVVARGAELAAPLVDDWLDRTGGWAATKPTR